MRLLTNTTTSFQKRGGTRLKMGTKEELEMEISILRIKRITSYRIILRDNKRGCKVGSFFLINNKKNLIVASTKRFCASLYNEKIKIFSWKKWKSLNKQEIGHCECNICFWNDKIRDKMNEMINEKLKQEIARTPIEKPITRTPVSRRSMNEKEK